MADRGPPNPRINLTRFARRLSAKTLARALERSSTQQPPPDIDDCSLVFSSTLVGELARWDHRAGVPRNLIRSETGDRPPESVFPSLLHASTQHVCSSGTQKDIAAEDEVWLGGVSSKNRLHALSIVRCEAST